MLENLFNLIKEQGTDSVINNPAVPNEQNDAVIASATTSVAEELKQEATGGGLQNIMAMFQGGQAGGVGSLLNNPIVGNIISNFKNKLTGQHGVQPQQAENIAGSLIPGVMEKVISKTNNPADSSFDMSSIIASLSGGAGGLDIAGIANKFTGGKLDTDGDGKIEISDIMSKVTGGTKDPKNDGESGGLMDMVKGFMK